MIITLARAAPIRVNRHALRPPRSGVVPVLARQRHDTARAEHERVDLGGYTVAAVSGGVEPFAKAIEAERKLEQIQNSLAQKAHDLAGSWAKSKINLMDDRSHWELRTV